jgi:DNA-directed RNA polymerase specialized sigma24 family protein
MSTALSIYRDMGKPDRAASVKTERSVPAPSTTGPTHQTGPNPSSEGKSLLTRDHFAHAFQVGYGLTVHALLGYGLSPSEAQEIAQSAWVKACMCSDQIRDPRKILRYVRMIAINAWRDDQRRRARLRPLAADYPAPTQDRVRLLDIKRVVSWSAPGQRAVLQRLLEGYSTAEMAELLGISRGAVLARISRAVRSARHRAEYRRSL